MDIPANQTVALQTMCYGIVNYTYYLPTGVSDSTFYIACIYQSRC